MAAERQGESVLFVLDQTTLSGVPLSARDGGSYGSCAVAARFVGKRHGREWFYTSSGFYSDFKL